MGVLGDTHGDMGHVLTVSRTMWKRGVSVLVVLGDFGFVWHGQNCDNNLDKLSRRLAGRGQVLYWLDGNHEDFAILYGKFPVSADGLRRLRPNVIHMPRGYRTVLASGKTLAVLGGANSIDRLHRQEGATWWPEESITEEDLRALGDEQVDVLVGHDAPLHVSSLDAALLKTEHDWPADMLAYSAAGRRMFHKGFLQVRPRSLYIGGHYHRHIDETASFGAGDDAFETRVVIMDMNGPGTISQGVLDVGTLDLVFFTRDDATVTELTGSEDGTWQVHTRDSVHVFDLDARTIERRPGPDAVDHHTGGLRKLISINTCRVGDRGFWTFESDDILFDYYWVRSSRVERIERVAGKQ
jgi:predicted phosphodiesterase